MHRDAYSTFIGAKGVAFAWLRAAFGPAFLTIGLHPEHRAHLLIGIVAIVLVGLSLIDGTKAVRFGSLTGGLAYGAVPIVLLVAGSIYAWGHV